MRKFLLIAGLVLLVPTFVIGDFINSNLNTILRILGAFICIAGILTKKDEIE